MAGSTTDIDKSAGGRRDAHSLDADQCTSGSEEAEPGGRPPTGPPTPADAPTGPLEVYLVLQTDDIDPPMSGWVERLLHDVARQAGVQAGRLTVVIVDEPAMTELHQRHCKVPGPTDVLTFDTRDQGDDPTLEADIVICLPEAVRQARRRGHPVRAEVLLYAVHGLLHLLGEDDHDPQAFARMHAREDELLAAVGVGPLFATSERDDEDKNESNRPDPGFA